MVEDLRRTLDPPALGLIGATSEDLTADRLADARSTCLTRRVTDYRQQPIHPRHRGSPWSREIDGFTGNCAETGLTLHRRRDGRLSPCQSGTRPTRQAWTKRRSGNFRRRRIRGASTPPPIGRLHCVRACLRSRDRRINRQRNRCRASNTVDRHRGKLPPPTKRQLATSTSGDRHRLVPRGSGGDTHAAVGETPQPLREEFRSGRGLGETGGSTERRRNRSGQVTCGSDRGDPHVTAKVRQLPTLTRHPTERRRLR